MPRVFAAIAVVLALASGRAARADARDQGTAGPRTELDFVPILGGNSDIGFGGGAVGAITRFSGTERQSVPWTWRVEGSTFASVRTSPNINIPYQDHWLLLTVPGLEGGGLRATARVAFTKENAIRYYGVGNAAPLPVDYGSSRYFYGRTHPTVETNARITVAPHVFATGGLSLTGNWFDIPQDGKLALDMRFGSPEVRALLGTANTNAVLLAQESIAWDSRDDEVIPHRGTFDEIDVRISPSFGDFMPYAYTEVLAIARVYVPLGPYTVAAFRALADGLVGDAPFFQLAEYDDTYALGGTSGIRGVVGQRYYGKVKLITNAELRSDFLHFRAIGKPWGIALATFFDVGRLWADWSFQPALDGTGLGLKWGTGLGLRVQQGTAFVVRGDVAWSPDAQPISGYFAAGEVF